MLDIWHIPFEGLTKESSETLSLEEKHKAERFVKEEDKRNYILSHTYLRKILTHYFPLTTEEEWEFKTNAFGRPSLSSKHQDDFYFNLSHTSYRAYLVCSNTPECGIDVEELHSLDFSPELLDLVMSEKEKTEFLASKDKEKLFFKYWTLKEAHVKALGKGLSLELKNIEFKALERQNIEFKVGDWTYFSELLEEKYYLSLAILDKETQAINFLTKEDL